MVMSGACSEQSIIMRRSSGYRSPQKHGEGVPESDELAARWYRKAADHFRDAGGVWEARVRLAYMYRDGHLKPDYVEAYMWFAVVGSSVDPPTDEDMKWAARHMTKAQIAQAQRMARDWVKRHTRQPENVAQALLASPIVPTPAIYRRRAAEAFTSEQNMLRYLRMHRIC